MLTQTTQETFDSHTCAVTSRQHSVLIWFELLSLEPSCQTRFVQPRVGDDSDVFILVGGWGLL